MDAAKPFCHRGRYCMWRNSNASLKNACISSLFPLIYLSMQILSNVPDPSKGPLPRRDLREAAFRKYEQYIAKALTERVFYIDTRTAFGADDFGENYKRPMLAATFCLRFNDAKLGFKRYGYQSNLIPRHANLACIKPTEYDMYTIAINNISIPHSEVVSRQQAVIPDFRLQLTDFETFLSELADGKHGTGVFTIPNVTDIEGEYLKRLITAKKGIIYLYDIHEREATFNLNEHTPIPGNEVFEMPEGFDPMKSL